MIHMDALVAYLNLGDCSLYVRLASVILVRLARRDG